MREALRKQRAALGEWWREHPTVQVLTGYRWDLLRQDTIAGLTVALLAVPQCMAYAMVAGLHPAYGLYAALIAAVVGGLTANSEHLLTGPTANIALVVGSILHDFDLLEPHEAAIYLAIEVGLLQLLFAALRLGNLSRFVSRAVVVGFLTGTAMVIIGDEVLALLNMAGSHSPHFALRAWDGITAAFGGRANPFTLPLALGAGTVLVMMALRYRVPRFPSGLLVILLGGALSFAFGLEALGVAVVGSVPAGLPPVTVPELRPDVFSGLLDGALALALLCSLQAVSVSRSLATSTRQPENHNRELVGQGCSNVAVGFFSGFPCTASLSRSFFNLALGARTRVAGLLCGGIVLLTILFAAPLAYPIPLAVLSGLIIVVALDIFNLSEMRLAFGTTRRDRAVFLTTLLAVLVLKLDTAIYAGIAISLVLSMRRAARVELREYVVDEAGELKHIIEVDERVEPKVALIDVNGEAFFGSADLIRMRVQHLSEASDELKVIILRMKNATNLDATGAQVLKELAIDLADQDRTLMVSGATPEVQEVLVKSEAAEAIGEDKILIAQKALLASTRQAIERAQDHIDSVLEGEVERAEEVGPLLHTLKHLTEGGAHEHPDEDPLTPDAPFE